jgi:hypothetical protein
VDTELHSIQETANFACGNWRPGGFGIVTLTSRSSPRRLDLPRQGHRGARLTQDALGDKPALAPYARHMGRIFVAARASRSEREPGSLRGPRARVGPAAAVMVFIATVASIATSEPETNDQVVGSALADVSLTPAMTTVDLEVTAEASADARGGQRPGEIEVVLYVNGTDQQPASVRIGSTDATAAWLDTAEKPDGGPGGAVETTVVAPGNARTIFHLLRSPAFVTCPPAASCIDRMRLRAALVGVQPSRIIVSAVARIRWETEPPPLEATMKVMIQEHRP